MRRKGSPSSEPRARPRKKKRTPAGEEETVLLSTLDEAVAAALLLPSAAGTTEVAAKSGLIHTVIDNAQFVELLYRSISPRLTTAPGSPSFNREVARTMKLGLTAEEAELEGMLWHFQMLKVYVDELLEIFTYVLYPTLGVALNLAVAIASAKADQNLKGSEFCLMTDKVHPDGSIDRLERHRKYEGRLKASDVRKEIAQDFAAQVRKLLDDMKGRRPKIVDPTRAARDEHVRRVFRNLKVYYARRGTKMTERKIFKEMTSHAFGPKGVSLGAWDIDRIIHPRKSQAR